MKELSIEEKAKAYDEVREKIAIRFGSNVADEIFSQFEMSEDEKIRKQLLKHLREVASGKSLELSTTDYERWATWVEKQGEHANFLSKIQAGDKVTRNEDGVLVNLSQLKRVAKKDEKQGEQKPILDFKAKDWYVSKVDDKIHNIFYSADKVESKFKVGDWVVSPNGVYWHVDAIRDGRYQVSSNSGESADWPLDTNIYHKFTIADAKDGDVLFIGIDGSTCIFKRLEGNLLYSYIISDGKLLAENSHYYYETSDNVHPATKEQCDLLFQKMKEAGYEWDAEKKELNKIEQKPAWSEEDEQYIIDTLNLLSFGCSTHSVGEVKDFLNSLKDRYTWKPSESDILLLERIANGESNPQDFQASLCSLIGQLKKLREK